MLVVSEVTSPANTADGRIVLHLLGDDQNPYEVSLTRHAASQAVLSILWAIGNLPDANEEAAEVPVITVQGEAEIDLGRSVAYLRVTMNGIPVAIELSKKKLTKLQAQVSAGLAKFPA